MSDQDDNWKHRGLKMKCATCIWYVEKQATVLGRCRRHAPKLSGWPAVYETDWCGDHKISERCVDKKSFPQEHPK